MARTIYTYIPDDEINGSRIVTMDNCFCKLFMIHRNDSAFFQSFKEELDVPALYILMNKEKREAYIGESDTFLSRLYSHIAKKTFWTEVIAFVSTDGSISKTEVQYLERLSYERAKITKVFELPENYQTPKLPHMNYMQKGKTEEFFKYVQFLAKFVGCDLFEFPVNTQVKDIAKTVAHVPLQVDIEIKPEDIEGKNVCIVLNGVEYAKGRMGYAMVKEYLKYFPQTTLAELKDFFHIGLLGSWGRWSFIEDDLEHAKSLRAETTQYRHLVKDEFVLTSGDNIKFVVSNQWDKVNMINLLQIAKNLGWSYEIKRTIK